MMRRAIKRRGGRMRRARLATSESGFGVIELLIAMTVMAVGIMAIVAGFSSGIVALNNASRTGTAGTLADKQMEAYRALQFDDIAIQPGTPQPATGPDGRAYIVDTTIAWDCPLGPPPPWMTTPPNCTGARPVKKVTVAVRDVATTKTLITETSTFDEAT